MSRLLDVHVFYFIFELNAALQKVFGYLPPHGHRQSSLQLGSVTSRQSFGARVYRSLKPPGVPGQVLRPMGEVNRLRLDACMQVQLFFFSPVVAFRFASPLIFSTVFQDSQLFLAGPMRTRRKCF